MGLLRRVFAVVTVAGLVLVLFGAYRQWWGTEAIYRDAQADLSTEFVAARSTAVDDPARVDLDPDPSREPSRAVSPVAQVQPGTPVARLTAHTIGLDAVVSVGSTTGELRAGPIQLPETVLPGEAGLSVVIGHRTSYGAPFGSLDELTLGDAVTVESLDSTVTYSVTAVEIIPGAELPAVLEARSGAVGVLLVTCHPKHSTRERLIVTLSPDRPELLAPPRITPARASVAPSDDDPIGAATLAGTDPLIGVTWFGDSAAWPTVIVGGLAVIALWLVASVAWRCRLVGQVGAVVLVAASLPVMWVWFGGLVRMVPDNF